MQRSLRTLDLVEAVAKPQSPRTRGLHDDVVLAFCLGQPLSEGSVRFPDLAQVLLYLELRERLTIVRKSDLDVERNCRRIRHREDEPLVLAIDPLALRLILLLLIARPHGIRSLKIRSSLKLAALFVCAVGVARVVIIVIRVLLEALVPILVRSLLEATTSRALVHGHVRSMLVVPIALVVVALIPLIASLSRVPSIPLIFPLVVIVILVLRMIVGLSRRSEDTVLIVAWYRLWLLEVVIALLLIVRLRILRACLLVIVV